MKLTIHRGSKEIGGTCIELQLATSRILIDFGLPLVDENKERFDSLTTKEFNFGKDFDKEKILNYLEIASISPVLSKKELLKNLVLSNQVMNIWISYLQRKKREG